MCVGGPFVRCFDRGLVDNRFCKTVIRHRTFTWFWQLHFFSLLVVSRWDSLDLLCPSMTCLKFVMQLWLILTVFLLNILCRVWIAGNSSSKILRKV